MFFEKFQKKLLKNKKYVLAILKTFNVVFNSFPEHVF